MRSDVTAVLSPNSWAMACWPISAFPVPLRMRRNAPFAPRIGILAEVGAIELPDGTRVQARIGIATGLVVVGEIIGTGTAQERTIVGETPNLAARLQSLAEPDCIIISELTQRSARRPFRTHPCRRARVERLFPPCAGLAGLRRGAVESRFAAIRTGGLPLIGRAHEMGLMRERWHLARQGEGQIVTLIGEAGIGKSRMIEALQESSRANRMRASICNARPITATARFIP